MIVRASGALWKAGGGYYTEAADELRARPVLPCPERLRDRRLLRLFRRHGNLRPGSEVLEVGCGRSPWLPYLARELGCRVTGIDVEPDAAELARANLEGAGAQGEIRCGDGFSLADNRDFLDRFDLVYSMGLIEHFDDAPARLACFRRYLKPGARILTTVPNLQGLNWSLQRLGGRDRLEMHVIYDAQRLARRHESAGFSGVVSGYVGFFDAYLSGTGPAAGAIRRAAHRRLCWALGISGEAWVRTGRGAGTREWPWLAPHVYAVGQRR